MVSGIDLKESLIDSPDFRSQINDYDLKIAQYETYLKNLLKGFNESSKLYQEYSKKQEMLCDMLEQYPEFLNRTNFNHSLLSPSIESCNFALKATIMSVSKGLREIERSRSMYLNQINELFITNLDQTLREDVPKTKEGKKLFDKSSDEFDNSLNKYMSKKEKDPNLNESYIEYRAYKDAFKWSSFNYTSTLKEFQLKSQLSFLENMHTLMYINYTFFHQGFEVLKSLESEMKEIPEHIKQMQISIKKNEEETLILKELVHKDEKNLSVDINAEEENGIPEDLYSSKQSGYLFLKSEGNYFPGWKRYYFKIEDDYLQYYARDKNFDPVESIDLRLCAVKLPNQSDRRFCFLLYSNSRTYVLQAENLVKRNIWIETLQIAIENSLKNHQKKNIVNGNHINVYMKSEDNLKSQSMEQKNSHLIDEIRFLPGNDHCADCSADSPTWVSINLGILLCIECSGIHRSLGVHISKVRSLTLDKMNQSLADVLTSLGNIKVNELIANGQVSPITPTSSREDKTSWIEAKYVQKTFLEPISKNQDELDKALYDAVKNKDILAGLKYILNGANAQFSNPQEKGLTPLHLAVQNQDSRYLEFLMLWSDNIDLVDESSSTPLHLSALTDNPRLVWHLLQLRANFDLKNSEDKTALDIALERAEVSIVMALRYFIFLYQTDPTSSTLYDTDYDEASETFGGGL